MFVNHDGSGLCSTWVYMASVKGELDCGAGTESAHSAVPTVALSSDVQESGRERIMSLFQRRLASDEARTLISQLLRFFFWSQLHVYFQGRSYLIYPSPFSIYMYVYK